jgi:redox-sensing transcriptional repressor
VYSIRELQRVSDQLNVSIAVVTVPVDVAQSVAETIMDAGIQALWNFTPCRIRVREHVVVQNTSLYSHLAVMYNRLRTCKQEK